MNRFRDIALTFSALLLWPQPAHATGDGVGILIYGGFIFIFFVCPFILKWIFELVKWYRLRHEMSEGEEAERKGRLALLKLGLVSLPFLYLFIVA